MADGMIQIGEYKPDLGHIGEQVPYDPQALTKGFQAATNLIETRWVNSYAQQMAQLNLKTAQSKLTYQDQYNDILKQQHDQNEQLFPLQLKQQNQVLQQNDATLAQLKSEADLNGQASSQVPDALKEINALDPDALDFDNQVTALKQKYAMGFNRQNTQGMLQGALNDKYVARQNSSVAQMENSQMQALETAQQRDHLIPSNVNVRQQVMQPGGADNLIRMANQTVLTNRVQTILQNSRPGTDSYNWANEMLGVLRNNDQSRAHQLFDAQGMLNDGVAQSLSRWETALGVTPKSGGIADEIKEEYDKNGKLVKSTRTYKNINPNAIPGQEAPNEKKVLPQSPADVAKDPVFQTLMKQIPPELSGANTTDAQRKAWVYQQYLAIKGQSPNQQTNQQTNQSNTANPPNTQQQFVTGAQPTPSPTPKRRGQQPAQPGATPTPPGLAPSVTYPKVRTQRPSTQLHVIAPPGERRRRPLGGFGYQEGGLVSGEGTGDGVSESSATDNIPANLTAGEYVVNPNAVKAIGTENLDALNRMAEVPAQPQADPFTMAFTRARQVTEAPDQLLAQLLQPQSGDGLLPNPYSGRTASEGDGQGRVQLGNYGVADASGHPVLHALAYGPNSEGATAADMRQVKGSFVPKLQNGDIAVSPNLLRMYPPLSRVNVVGPDGKIVMRDARVADTSWYSKDHPTTNTFEIYNGPSLGQGYHLVPAGQGETAQQ